LSALLELVLPIEPSWEAFREDLAYLSDFAIAFRHPGESADHELAVSARERCRGFRDAARKALVVSVHREGQAMNHEDTKGTDPA